VATAIVGEIGSMALTGAAVSNASIRALAGTASAGSAAVAPQR
jgi:hypothetical protein